MTFDEYWASLEEKIKGSYDGLSLIQTEGYSIEFLMAMSNVSQELHKADLDARTKKANLKRLKAALYLESVNKQEKKPTEAMLTATIDSDSLVSGEQASLDEAESYRDEIQRRYEIALTAHRHFKDVMKGSYNG